MTIGGTVTFALARYTLDVDTGAAVLPDATLDILALSVSNAYVDVAGVATVTVIGNLAFATVTPNGTTVARYTALKMGDVTVSASAGSADTFGLTGTLAIDSLDYNSAQATFKRLDWSSAFGDLVVDPSEALGLDEGTLAIDFPAALEVRLTGSITGAGPSRDLLTVAGVTLSGSIDFALTQSSADVVIGGVHNDATLTTIALRVATPISMQRGFDLGLDHVRRVRHRDDQTRRAALSTSASTPGTWRPA